jgi:hypothetical protein
MPIGNGGIIGVANNPTDTVASGVWSLQEQFKAEQAGDWPVKRDCDWWRGIIRIRNSYSPFNKLHSNHWRW